MPTNIILTDEPADLAGYLRAKLGSRSDNPSLVRAVVNTAAGPSSGVQWTRTAGGTALAWITDPLDGTDLTAAAWVLHLWAHESNATANAALRVQVYQFTNAEAGTALLDSNPGTELPTATRDAAVTTGAATATTMADGDRLVIKILIDDAGTMAAGYTATLAYNGQYPRAEGDSYLTCPDTLAVTAAIPAATRTRIRRLLKVASDSSDYTPLLSDNEIDVAIGSAVRTYSKDRPRIVVDALSGDGSTTDLTLPRLWIVGFSVLHEVEHPTGNNPRTVVEPDDYEVLESVLGTQPTRKLRFVSAPESGTDNILVRYSTRHTHTDDLDTIPETDFDAVCWLAASHAADTLAARQANATDSTIAADSVNYRDGEQRWRSVAKRFRELYDQHIGADGSVPVAPAGRVRDWDTNLASGADRLTHWRRRR